MDIVFIAVIALMIAATLWWVLKPILSTQTDFEVTERADLLTLGELEMKRDAIYSAIKDLELDFESGKIAEQDYQQGRLKFLQQVAAILKQIDALSGDFESRLEAQVDALLADDEIAAADDLRAAARAELRAKIETITAGTSDYTCPHCGRPFEAGDTFCTECGASLTTECPACHGQVLLGDKFCPHCGEAMTTAEVAS